MASGSNQFFSGIPRVIVVGHSFVSRLEEALTSPRHPYCRPNLDLRQCNVEFFGSGSWSVGAGPEGLEQLKTKMRPIFQASRYDAVVMHLGDNNCCTMGQFSPLGLASLLDEFALSFLKECGVSVVNICQLFPRPKPRNVPPAVYESRRRLIINIWELCWTQIV